MGWILPSVWGFALVSAWGVSPCMLGSEMGKILLPIMTQIQFETNVSRRRNSLGSQVQWGISDVDFRNLGPSVVQNRRQKKWSYRRFCQTSHTFPDRFMNKLCTPPHFGIKIDGWSTMRPSIFTTDHSPNIFSVSAMETLASFLSIILLPIVAGDASCLTATEAFIAEAPTMSEVPWQQGKVPWSFPETNIIYCGSATRFLLADHTFLYWTTMSYSFLESNLNQNHEYVHIPTSCKCNPLQKLVRSMCLCNL